jgi:hypothetical protein
MGCERAGALLAPVVIEQENGWRRTELPDMQEIIRAFYSRLSRSDVPTRAKEAVPTCWMRM